MRGAVGLLLLELGVALLSALPSLPVFAQGAGYNKPAIIKFRVQHGHYDTPEAACIAAVTNPRFQFSHVGAPAPPVNWEPHRMPRYPQGCYYLDTSYPTAPPAGGSPVSSESLCFDGTVWSTANNHVCPVEGNVRDKNRDPGQPLLCSANPINTATGSKLQVDTDYTGAGVHPLELRRAYSSRLPDLGDMPGAVGAFGPQWRSAYDRSLFPTYTAINPSSVTTVVAWRADGRALAFRPDAGVWKSSPDVTDTLARVTDGTGNTTSWIYTDAQGDVRETYTPEGRLTALANRSGVALTLAYNAQGRLQSVTDAVGRTLTYAYNAAGRVQSVTAPGGAVYGYGYDAAGNLATVTYPDLTQKTYLYNEPAYTGGANLPHALTGIVDERGTRYATYTYDSSGRAVRSEHAGGAGAANLTYHADGSVAETDALGGSRTFGFEVSFGVPRHNATTGDPCGPRGGSAAVYGPSNGFITSRTDWNGYRTDFQHNARGLEELRVEGLTGGGGTTAATLRTETLWHPTFRLPVSIIEKNGAGAVLRTTTLGYDANGNPTSRVIASGGRTRAWNTSYTYSGTAPGVIETMTVTDPRGQATTFSYYPATDSDPGKRGNLWRVTNPLGHVSEITGYNAHGQPTTTIDPNGVVTTLNYDARQRLVSRVTAGEITSFDYDEAGLVTRVIQPDGSFVRYEHDAAQRVKLASETDLGYHEERYTLDAMGNRRIEELWFDIPRTGPPSTAGELLKRVERSYNRLNQLEWERGAQGQTTTYTYDKNGNLEEVRAPLLRVTTHRYDARNRRTSTVDPAAGTTSYAYDPLGQLTGVTDPRGLATTYTINGLAETTALASPDTGVTTFSHDAAGNVLSRTNAAGQTTATTYDALGRPLTQLWPGGSVTYGYDSGAYGKGRRTSMTDLTGTTTWSYDAHGRVTEKTQTADGVSLTVRYQYNAKGQMTRITLPSGKVLDLAYLSAGDMPYWLGEVKLNGQTVFCGDLQRPFHGPWVRYVVGTASAAEGGGCAIEVLRQFDLDGRITRYDVGLDGGHPTNNQWRWLHYDAASRITHIRRIFDKPAGPHHLAFEYDALDRVTRNHGLGLTAPLEFTYDATGNRTSHKVDTVTTNYQTVPGSNRLASVGIQPYTHSAAGHVASNGQTAFTYDGRERLVSATRAGQTTAYSINGLGERVKKAGPVTGTVRFLYDEEGRLLGEYDQAGGAIQEYFYYQDSPVMILKGAQVYYITPDHLGTPRAVVQMPQPLPAGGTWKTVWRWEGEAFGGSLPTEDPDGDGTLFKLNLRFPGQYFDIETGVHYNYFRDYEPQTGRYVQSDPIGLLGGINTYAYANSDPLRTIDPKGLASCLIVLDSCEEQLVRDLALCEAQNAGCTVACRLLCSRSGPLSRPCAEVCSSAACGPLVSLCRKTAFGQYELCRNSRPNK